MKNRRFAKTISSPLTEQYLAEALLAMGESFYLIYSIVIETGISFKALFDLKVGDIPNPPSFPHYIHIEGAEDRPLSPKLQEHILAYIDGRNADEYFIAPFNNSGEKFNLSSFYTAFKRVLAGFHLENEYSPMSLRKTYAYHIFLEIEDPFLMRKLLKLNSVEAVYNYFGFEPPAHLRKNRLSFTKKSLEYQLFLLQKNEEQAEQLFYALKSFSQITQDIADPSKKQDLLKDSDELLQDIDSLLSTCLKKIEFLTQVKTEV